MSNGPKFARIVAASRFKKNSTIIVLVVSNYLFGGLGP